MPWNANRSGCRLRPGCRIRRSTFGRSVAPVKKMTCAGTPPAQARMIVLQATRAELEGGPDEHHGWAGRAPRPDHLRLGGPRQRPDPPGRIAPATRTALRGWLGELPSLEGGFAVEGCTGWRFVVEELQAAGVVAHLAEPAETSNRRGPKRRATTDRADARLLGELLEQGRLPSSWIPPAWILDLRTTVRLRKTLVDQRTAWQQRIHAALFHHGLPRPTQELLSGASRAWLAGCRCRRPAARPWPSRCARSTGWTPSWTRSTNGCARWPAASRAAGRS